MQQPGTDTARPEGTDQDATGGPPAGGPESNSGLPAADSPAAGPGRRRPSGTWLAGAVVLVAALVFAIVELDMAHGRADRLQTQASLRASALRAATAYGGYLSSYSYKDLSDPTSSWSEVESHSTASYRKSFNSTKSELTSLIKDYKASASGKVTAAGVSSSTSNRAVVLLFVNQTVTNSTQKSGAQTQPFRVRLTLLRRHGEWLIDAVQTS